MARRTSNFTVTKDGRDAGKMFVITEMSAAQCESWAMRVLLALLATNPNIPADFADLGTAALAQLGMQTLGSLQWAIAEPLLAEMIDCVSIMPDPKKPAVVRPLLDSDIEEVSTRLDLRLEWWTLHMGFLQAVVPSMLTGNSGQAAEHKRNTRTSAK